MINLGVMGYGGRINSVIETIRRIEPEIKVTGIIDPDRENALKRVNEHDKDAVVFYRSVPEMMRKARPDALLVGTRCNLHTRYAIAAAKHDVPLFLEKPVAISMSQATALEKAFTKSKCKVVVSFPLRVSPLCELAKKYIADRAVGEPVHAMADNYVPYGTVYWEHLYRDYNITGGLFLQKATHDLDYLMYLMDSPIVNISATATFQKIFGGKKRSGLKCSKCRQTETCPESPENRVRYGYGEKHDHNCVFSVDCGTPETGTNEDCSSALLEFESGAHGVYTQVFYARRDSARRGATISGYKGAVVFDWYANELKRIRHHEPFSAVEKATGSASHFGGDSELAHDFLELIKYGKEPRTPIRTGIQSVYACLAARESLAKRKMVKVRQVKIQRHRS